MASESHTAHMDTNSKILQKLDEILSCITRLDQAFKSTSYHPAIRDNNCQGYEHVVDNCSRPVIVTKVKETSVTNPESLPPLLPTPTVVVYSGRQPLPPLLPTPSIVCSGRQPLPPILPTPSPVKIAIDKLSITESESDSEEFIYQVEEPQDFNSDKENMGGNIEVSNTSSPLEVIPVTTKFIHVFPKDLSLIHI